MDRHKSLETMLLSMFTADELRRVIRYMPDGETIAAALPGVNASPASVVSEAVATLARTGHLQGSVFWDRIAAERPRRVGEIAARRAEFEGPEPAENPTPSSTSSPSSSMRKVTILLLSASPDTRARLRVDKEFREIIDRLRGSRYRDSVHLVQVTAARFEDLRRALLEHEPHILHVSAHGDADGTLVFETREDRSGAVTSKQLVRLLRAIGRNLRLVVLNVCNSAELARELGSIVGCGIGMREEIVDGEAIEFAVALYESLAYGKSVETSFSVAVSGLDVEDDDAPQLFPEAGDDPTKRRDQPLITGGGA